MPPSEESLTLGPKALTQGCSHLSTAKTASFGFWSNVTAGCQQDAETSAMSDRPDPHVMLVVACSNGLCSCLLQAAAHGMPVCTSDACDACLRMLAAPHQLLVGVASALEPLARLIWNADTCFLPSGSADQQAPELASDLLVHTTPHGLPCCWQAVVMNICVTTRPSSW